MQVHDAGECAHHSLEMAALDDGARDPSSRPDLSVPEHAGCSDASTLRTDVRASAGPRSFLAANCFLTAVQGFAFGEKKAIGRSRAVRNPAGASKITGMELTTTDAVAISPGEPPGITSRMSGCPFNSMESAGSFAPTYICNSR